MKVRLMATCSAGIVLAVLVKGFCTLPAETLPPDEESTPSPLTYQEGEFSQPEYFRIEQNASDSIVWNLPFYPPGQAPSERQEYSPVPFEDLLPKHPNMDNRPEPIYTAE